MSFISGDFASQPSPTSTRSWEVEKDPTDTDLEIAGILTGVFSPKMGTPRHSLGGGGASGTPSSSHASSSLSQRKGLSLGIQTPKASVAEEKPEDKMGTAGWDAVVVVDRRASSAQSFTQQRFLEECSAIQYVKQLHKEGGVNTTYYAYKRDPDSGKDVIIGIFKPCDGEAGGVNCAAGRGEVLQAAEGVEIGTQWQREIIAYYLDETWIRAGIPPTTQIEIASEHFIGDEKRKTGSIQKFVSSAKDLHHVPKVYLSNCLKKLSDLEVQKLALLDLILANPDRHKGNLMLNEDETRPSLMPIDHGCTLPDDFASSGKFIWVLFNELRGTKTPLLPEIREILDNMNFERIKGDVLSLCPEFSLKALDTLEYSLRALKLGMQAALNFQQIAAFYVGCDKVEGLNMSEIQRCFRESRSADLPQQAFDELINQSIAKIKGFPFDGNAFEISNKLF